MKRTTFLQLGIALTIAVVFHLSPANAMVGSKLDINSISEAESAQVQQFINTEVRADLAEHFEDRLKALSEKTSIEPPMSPETQAVLLKGAFLTLAATTAAPLSEETFNKYAGAALDFLRTHGMLPHAITVGVLMRKTWEINPAAPGAPVGATAGFNYGAEMNFYLQGGQLKMTNYSLLGGQGGVGTAVSDVEYYMAFCYGSCFGGDPNGWYMGTDINATAGPLGGIGAFAELGIDVSSIYQSLFKDKKKFTVKDLYDASTIYVGFGGEVGIGTEAATGLYRYKQIGIEKVLSNIGQTPTPEQISSQASYLKP